MGPCCIYIFVQHGLGQRLYKMLAMRWLEWSYCSILNGISHVLVSIANLRITEAQWGSKIAALVFSAGITECPWMAHGRYEGVI